MQQPTADKGTRLRCNLHPVYPQKKIIVVAYHELKCCTRHNNIVGVSLTVFLQKKLDTFFCSNERKNTKCFFRKMPFEATDYYFQKDLSDFYGSRINEFDYESECYMGHDGSNFVYDRYRRWLMLVLKATGCLTIQAAMEKYPFIKDQTESIE